MAKKLYIGVNSVARKVSAAYIGVSSIAQKIVKGYIGVNNIARLFYESKKPDEEITFTSSQSWVVPSDAKTIDIFVVGGGGGAGGYYANCNDILQFNATYRDCVVYGAYGGAGYTNTVSNVSVTPGETLTVVVGAGGTGGKGCRIKGSSNIGDVSSNAAVTAGSDGGESYVSRGSSKLASANGGKGGGRAASSSQQYYVNGVKGANGGNASGAGGSYYEQITIDSQGSGTHYDLMYVEHVDGSYYTAGLPNHGTHGTNGGNGGGVDYWIDNNNTTQTKQSNNAYTGGTGQGHNTKKFGEASGTVYATVGTEVSANTGNSGIANIQAYTTRNGSSGVVIILCHY